MSNQGIAAYRVSHRDLTLSVHVHYTVSSLSQVIKMVLNGRRRHGPITTPIHPDADLPFRHRSSRHQSQYVPTSSTLSIANKTRSDADVHVRWDSVIRKYPRTSHLRTRIFRPPGLPLLVNDTNLRLLKLRQGSWLGQGAPMVKMLGFQNQSR